MRRWAAILLCSALGLANVAWLILNAIAASLTPFHLVNVTAVAACAYAILIITE